MVLSPEPMLHLAEFRRALLGWYGKHRRLLPWRENRDPYPVWVSEIMLQQTRVAAVLLRYQHFLSQFPSVEALAAARQASVLTAWSGLGYYRRARNLQAAAKIIVSERQGKLPETAEEWHELPGIGRYTAAAIASIARNQAVAVLDGNVERVLVRLSAQRDTRKKLWERAEQLLDPRRPGDFNQAMMELGAVVCLPSWPRCQDCPIQSFCHSRGPGQPRRPKPRQQKREIAYGLAQRQGAILLVRRDPGVSLMPGMWELPEVRTSYVSERVLFSLRHSITVTNFRVHVIETRVSGRGRWVKISRLPAVPLTGVTKKILRKAGIID